MEPEVDRLPQEKAELSVVDAIWVDHERGILPHIKDMDINALKALCRRWGFIDRGTESDLEVLPWSGSASSWISRKVCAPGYAALHNDEPSPDVAPEPKAKARAPDRRLHVQPGRQRFNVFGRARSKGLVALGSMPTTTGTASTATGAAAPGPPGGQSPVPPEDREVVFGGQGKEAGDSLSREQ